METNKFISSLVLLTALSSPVVASALSIGNSLTIRNHTNHDSTSIINDGRCSVDVLHEGGVTRKHTDKTIPAAALLAACLGHFSDCKADVYMTDNCTGAKVAVVHFSIYTGIIQPIVTLDPSYIMTGTGFEAQIDGGPDLAVM